MKVIHGSYLLISLVALLVPSFYYPINDFNFSIWPFVILFSPVLVFKFTKIAKLKNYIIPCIYLSSSWLIICSTNYLIYQPIKNFEIVEIKQGSGNSKNLTTKINNKFYSLNAIHFKPQYSEKIKIYKGYLGIHFGTYNH